MNFLAHAYLSFSEPEVLVGNMISDSVKGRKKFDFSAGIQKGIGLHRAIDAFTDNHEATKEAKQYLRPAVGPYSGAFVDVAYDHFLATDQNQFLQKDLQQFSIETYKVLNDHVSVLPDSFSRMLPIMASQNWLYNYQSLWGTEKSFGGVVKRAKYLETEKEVFALFMQNYSALQKCYNRFFPTVKSYALTYLAEL